MDNLRIDNPKKEILAQYNKNLFDYINANNELFETLYLDLGIKTVRILNYSKEFTPHIKKQLPFILRNSAENYDATIVLWKENDVKQIYKHIIPELNPATNLKRRVELIASKKGFDVNLWIFKNNNPVLYTDTNGQIINSYDKETETYFYGVKDLEPEEFIKQGHIFVQIFNKILKTEKSNLVHGACLGLNNKGILFCARGQRGKSTLAVLAMLKGFEYVSDDYFVLEKEENKLYTYPIYSIITLSPRMYNELYEELDGTRFISNNARKDKYVINIGNHHDTFKTKYPVRICMFPEIVSDKEPSIRKCTGEEKGRAIIHLVHSTVSQMGDSTDIKTVKKIMDMVKDLDFYKINLSYDIYKNVECLREFTKKL